ncbi:MAG: DUF4214 domain-containing protein, partial [Limisphaerales bacterium]
VSFSPLRLFAPNTCLNFSAAGDVNGVPAVQAGSLSIGGSGGSLALSGDFSGLGAAQVRVEVYLNSQLQGGGTLGGGAIGNLMLSGNLTAAGVTAQQLGFWLRFAPLDSAGGAGFTFSSGGLNLAGDELRVFAVNPTQRLGPLTTFGIRGCNTVQMALVGETVTPLIGSVIANAGGRISFSAQGAAGQIYRLEGTPNLGAQTAWRTIATAQADDEGYVNLQDTPSASQQFYRIAVPPGGGTDNLTFLQIVYQGLLNRALDPGSESYWLNYLASGGSRSNVVAAITATYQYRVSVAQNAFNKFLNRSPQPSDLAYWDTFLQMGGTDEQMIGQIIGSPEYFASRGGSSNAGFLQAMYA